MAHTDLRSIRLSLGRTLDDHAALAKVDPSTISRLERGEQIPRPSSLMRIAEAYGITADRVYGYALLAKSANSSDEKGAIAPDAPSHARNDAQAIADAVTPPFAGGVN